MNFYFKDDRPYVSMKINGTTIEALVDTGADFSVLPVSTCKTLGLKGIGAKEFRGFCTGKKGVELPLYECKIEILGKTLDIHLAGGPDTLRPIFGKNELSKIKINLDWKGSKITAEDC